MKEEKKKDINQGKQTKMNAAKIKRQIFERTFKRARLTCNKQLDTEKNAHLQLAKNVVYHIY